MSSSTSVGILPLLVLICLATLLYPTPTTCSTNDTDFLSLLALKNAIHDPLGALNSWNGTTQTQFCRWEGIKCSRRHPGRVTGIWLSSKGLVGSLSPAIGNISFLRVIDLQNNSFGGVIPNEIGLLRRLSSIEFSNNSFSGAIPTNLSHCSNLVYLNLIDNRLSGAIPPELGSLSKLTALGLGKNNLSGFIPPSIGNLTSLEVLFIVRCKLIGEIPESLGQLRKLKHLILWGNGFTGTISPILFNISTMIQFDVRGNHLRGSIPSNIGFTLPNLVLLNLAQNQFSGEIPTSLANVSSLKQVFLLVNHFYGRMPMLGSLSLLRYLVVSINQIEDDINFISPLVNCTYLEVLEIGSNPISGKLPNSIANLSNHLVRLGIGDTLVHGNVPSSIGNLALNYLDLSNNNIEGNIPSTIGKLSDLGELYLGGNRFTGEVPYSFGNLTLLTILSMEVNQLSGSIPKSLNHCTNLFSLDISYNNLSDAIPIEIMTLPSLSILLDLSSNAFTKSLPPEIGSLTKLSALDLSNNRFFGVIPNSISGCQSLERLHLQGNLFEGDIPQGISNLKGLQDLDLSRNLLTGSIPSFLGVLKLERLNLSYNRLHGEVPMLGVFANQSAISMEGNREFCGGILELKLPPCSLPNSSKNNTPFLLKLLIPIAFAFFLCLGGIIFLHAKKKFKKDLPSLPASSFAQFLRLSYEDLVKATNAFSESNLVGVGRFGSVYKGILRDGKAWIAVKVLNLRVQGASKSFLKECNALRHIRHRNLLKILSVCESIDFKGNEFKSLVYEFKGNGSLDKWMYQDFESNQGIDEKVGKLDIVQRLNIVIDIAHALEYLHYGIESIIVHGDLKPSNILLDDDMTACVGDFGLAKVFSSLGFVHENNSSIGVKGTIGYIPPEYGTSNSISTHGDVYSYGILLLEIFTNRRPTDNLFIGHLNLHNFVSVALPDCIEEIVDPLIWIGHDTHDEKVKGVLVSVLKIGVACSEGNPNDRMSMTEVVNELCKIKASF